MKQKDASMARNDSAFSMNEDDLRKFVVVLILLRYHTLPQQQLYWDRRTTVSDANTPIVY